MSSIDSVLPQLKTMIYYDQNNLDSKSKNSKNSQKSISNLDALERQTMQNPLYGFQRSVSISHSPRFNTVQHDEFDEYGQICSQLNQIKRQFKPSRIRLKLNNRCQVEEQVIDSTKNINQQDYIPSLVPIGKKQSSLNFKTKYVLNGSDLKDK